MFIRAGSAVYWGPFISTASKSARTRVAISPFAFEITNQVKWDEENVLAISVENVLKPERALRQYARR